MMRRVAQRVLAPGMRQARAGGARAVRSGRSMRYGSLFIALSASLLWLAVVAGGAGLALLWPALSFALVGAAYLARQPALL